MSNLRSDSVSRELTLVNDPSVECLLLLNPNWLSMLTKSPSILSKIIRSIILVIQSIMTIGYSN